MLVPLRDDPTDSFVLEMASLPHPIPHTNAFMLHNPSKHYLVISECRTHYFFVDYFNVCRKYDDLLICPPMESIYNQNTECCELTLFLQKISVYDLCKTQIVKDFPPIFIRQNHGWI